MHDGDHEKTGAAHDQEESGCDGGDREGDEALQVVEDLSREPGLDHGGTDDDDLAPSRMGRLDLVGDPAHVVDEPVSGSAESVSR